MKARILIVLSLVALFSACEKKTVEISQKTLDSLRNELAINREMNKTLEEIGVLIDSIDANRKLIRTRALEASSYESYVQRMQNINDYVKKTEARMAALQRTARKSNDGALKAAIKQLERDLDMRNNELAAIKEQLGFFQKENEGLVKMVAQQHEEINKTQTDLKSAETKTVQLEDQVSKLMTQAKVDQGEALFARAQEVEETARRTHFAPKKKRNTKQKAVELYKMALAFGKTEAQDRIAALEK
jgi:chromosome segregation ATPase